MKLYNNRKWDMRWKLPLVLLMVLTITLSVPGCGKKAQDTGEVQQSQENVEVAVNADQQPDGQVASATKTQEEDAAESRGATAAEAQGDDVSDSQATEKSSQQSKAPAISEDGTYTTKDDVALYLHTYRKLPQNFITKKQAKKLGWTGGDLEDYAPGKCIGGDYFGNYEGLLPEDKEYHECDIGTLGKKKRGAKRIIYSDDGYIYYTEDHYETFELLYEP